MCQGTWWFTILTLECFGSRTLVILMTSSFCGACTDLTIPKFFTGIVSFLNRHVFEDLTC